MKKKYESEINIMADSHGTKEKPIRLRWAMEYEPFHSMSVKEARQLIYDIKNSIDFYQSLEREADPWVKLMNSQPSSGHVLCCAKHELMVGVILHQETPYYCSFCRRMMKPEELKWMDWEKEVRHISNEEYERRVHR